MKVLVAMSHAHESIRVGRLAKAAGFLVALVALGGCGSSVQFDSAHGTQHLNAGRYAVAVVDDCGTPVLTVIGDIKGQGWTFPIIAGSPLTIPKPGDYTVLDPIGSDLMRDTPQCALELQVSLTPTKS